MLMLATSYDIIIEITHAASLIVISYLLYHKKVILVIQK